MTATTTKRRTHYPPLAEALRWMAAGAGLVAVSAGVDPVRVCSLVGGVLVGSAAYSVYAMFRDAGREL